MTPSQTYIALSIIALGVIAFLVFVVGKKKGDQKLSPVAGLAFSCILAGVLFGENRILGYGFMGAGILLAVIDIILKRLPRNP